MEALPLKQRYPQAALLALIFFQSFASRVAIGPILPEIEHELHLSHTKATSIFIYLNLAYFVMMSFSGFAASRLKHRGCIMASAFLTGTGCLIFATAHSLVQLTLGVIIFGISAGFYLPSGVAAMTSMVRRQDWGKAMALHEMAPNLAFVLMPLLADTMLEMGGWRGLMGTLSAVAVVMGFVYLLRGKGGDFPGTPPKTEAVKAIASQPISWLIMAFFGLGIGASIGVYNIVPLYLVNEHGFNLETANSWIAASRAPCFICALAAGAIIDRMGLRTSIFIIFTLCGLATIGLGLAPGGMILPFLFMQPFIAVAYFPGGFAAIGAVSEPSQRNLAVSVIIPTGMLLGGGLLPALLGAAGQYWSFGVGITIFGGLIALGSLLAFRLPKADSGQT